MPGDIPEWLTLIIGPLGLLVFLLLVVVYGGRRRWWVFGWQYDDIQKERDRYRELALFLLAFWIYNDGIWKERKVTPDRWEILYTSAKRRKGHAPEGSGAPVGTEYHWYILAHQNTAKQTANDYTTSLTGLKFKIAHKRAGSEKWSATPKTQRKRMIKFLQDVIADLEAQQEEPAEKPAATAPAAKKAARKRQPATPKSLIWPQSCRPSRTPSRVLMIGAGRATRSRSFPGGAILSNPECFHKPANGMAECAKPEAIDSLRVIGFGLAPA